MKYYIKISFCLFFKYFLYRKWNQQSVNDMKQRDITPYNILNKIVPDKKNGGENSESENKNGNFTSEIIVFI